MRDDVRAIIEQTLDEIRCGARTLDTATELDIALTSHGFQIVKITHVKRPPFIIEDNADT